MSDAQEDSRRRRERRERAVEFGFGCHRDTVIAGPARTDSFIIQVIALTLANSAVSRETSSALTRVTALLIDALSVRGTHMITGSTLVHVYADRTAVLLVQILVPFATT